MRGGLVTINTSSDSEGQEEGGPRLSQSAPTQLQRYKFGGEPVAVALAGVEERRVLCRVRCARLDLAELYKH